MIDRLLRLTHARYRRLLTERLDGVLNDAGRTRLERHLAGCPSCRRELAELEALTALLRTQPMPEPPRSFILSYAPVQETRTARFGLPSLRALQMATATAAMLLVALIATDLSIGPATLPAADTLLQTRSQAPEADIAQPGASQPEALQSGARQPEALEMDAAAPPDDTGSTTQTAAPSQVLAAPPPAPPQAAAPSRTALDWAQTAAGLATAALALALALLAWRRTRIQ